MKHFNKLLDVMFFTLVLFPLGLIIKISSEVIWSLINDYREGYAEWREVRSRQK